jgi:hypothetical protein
MIEEDGHEFVSHAIDIIIFIMLLIVVYQSIKAARQNTVDALKLE